ncbi:hypothetical protein NMY22_g9230 [Coprinellus aureogranulatus]|nr:hypothetical protein NMY22_g9230 [Coprinellus aureogranulatus]
MFRVWTPSAQAAQLSLEGSDSFEQRLVLPPHPLHRLSPTLTLSFFTSPWSFKLELASREEEEDEERGKNAGTCLPPATSPWRSNNVCSTVSSWDWRVESSALGSGRWTNLHPTARSPPSTSHTHPSSEPKVDGCPVVELHDSAEDLENALLALYGDPAHIGTMAKPCFSSLAAMIRIGKKYEIHYLRDEGLARLKREFPATLQVYDRKPNGWANFAFRSAAYGNISTIDALFHIINLAHECRIQTILPALYLLASSHALDTLIYSAKVPISKDALLALICGREELIQAKRDLVAEFGRCADCVGFEECTKAAQYLLSEWWRWSSELASSAGAFNSWPALMSSIERTLAEAYELRFCHACLEDARTTHTKSRQRMWNELPGYFRLPAWGQLEDFRG